MMKSKLGSAGFTLLEMLIVLGIMSVLVGVGVAMMTDVFGDAEEAKAKGDIQSIQANLLRYKIKGGIYPTEEQGLMALVRRPESQPQPSSWKPYVKAESYLIDPWGNPYQYKIPGQYNKDTYDVFSIGQDQKAGTEDDIGNWE